MHERQAIKKRVKSLLEGIWLSFYYYPATTGYLFLIISDQQFMLTASLFSAMEQMERKMLIRWIWKPA